MLHVMRLLARCPSELLGELSEREARIDALNAEVEGVHAKEMGSRRQINELQNKVNGQTCVLRSKRYHVDRDGVPRERGVHTL